MTQTVQPRELRDYQIEARDAVLAQWAQNTRRTCVVLPTGTGKSSVIAAVAAESARKGARVVMLAHRGELLEQMHSTYSLVAPDLPPAGIVRADINEADKSVIVASIQTLLNPGRHEETGRRDVVLWDEAHHAGAPSWQGIVHGYGDPFLAGFSATMRREDGRALAEMIDTVAYERSLRWAIDKGHLVQPRGKRIVLDTLDLEQARVSRGDYQENDLADIMESELPEIAAALIANAPDRRTIAFVPGVENARQLAEILTLRGLSAEAVTGDISFAARQPIYERFRRGLTRVMVTVAVLSEGADFPMCDCVFIARPTRSSILYSQMVGRALRPYPGKTDALICDLVGTSRVVGLMGLTQLDTGAATEKVDRDGDPLELDDDEIEGLPGGGDGRPRMRIGPVELEDFDLLALSEEQTDIAWLLTRKGVPFCLPQGATNAVFLWRSGRDADGEVEYRIGWMSSRGRKEGGWLFDQKAWPLEVAAELAEAEVMRGGTELPNRRQAWRQQRGGPSDAQKQFARSLKIAGAEQMTKPQLSDAISIALMSPRLDPR